jgi:hypothetical protein
MPRPALLGAPVAAILLALLPSASLADTIDPAPVRSLTTTDAVNGVAVQPGTGNVYVSANNGFVHVYAPTAAGSDAPLFSFNPGCTPWQITFNPAGTRMLLPCSGITYELDPSTGAVIHSWTGPAEARSAVYAPGSDSVYVADRFGNKIYRMQASADGVGTVVLDGGQPASALSGPAGLAYTSDGTLYVANNLNDTISEYVQPTNGPAVNPLPARTITLPGDVNETQSVTLDSRGNLYVGAFTGGVLLYPPGASGAAAPTRWIKDGPNSGNGTTQVALLADRSLLVGQYGGPRVARFAPLVPIEPPGAVTGLKVTGKKTAKKRGVTWTAGAALDAPVASYRVTFTRGAKTVLTATTSAPSYVLRAKKLKRSGKYTATVVATSATGTSVAAAKTFKVKLKKRPHHHHPHPHQHHG